jgi:hypothetical protein
VANGQDKVLEETRDCLRCMVEKHQRGDLPDPKEIEKLNMGLNSRMKDAARFFEPHATSEEPATVAKQNELKLYACNRFVSLMRYSMLQLRNMLTFVVYGYVAPLLCITVYPFQERRTLGRPGYINGCKRPYGISSSFPVVFRPSKSRCACCASLSG